MVDTVAAGMVVATVAAITVVGVGVRIGDLTTTMITDLHREMRWPTACTVSNHMILGVERIWDMMGVVTPVLESLLDKNTESDLRETAASRPCEN